MLFSTCSQTENVYDPRVSLVNLWGQVIGPRGQILVSRTDDATLRVVRCAFVRCALLVCNVFVLVLVLVLVCHADPLLLPLLSPHTDPSPCVRSKRHPCAHSKRPRENRHHARKCYHMRAWCRYTRGRFECTHKQRARAECSMVERRVGQYMECCPRPILKIGKIQGFLSVNL